MNVYAHFGLRCSPFSAETDRDVFFSAPPHEEALATLRYGVQTRRPCVAVIGELGSGKTFLASQLCRSRRDGNPTLWIHGSGQTDKPLAAIHIPAQFWDRRCALPQPQPLSHLLDALRQARSIPLIVVDDADALEDGHWNQLSALVTQDMIPTPALTLVLLGGQSLRNRLTRHDLARLRRRIFRVCPLRPFSREQVQEYLDCRLAAVGGAVADVFDNEALDSIASLTHGSPGLINQLADNALIEACSAERERVTHADVLMAVYAMLGVADGKPEALRLPQASTPVNDEPGETDADSSPAPASNAAPAAEPVAATQPVSAAPFAPPTGPSEFESRMRHLQDRMRSAMAAVRDAGRADDEDIIDAEVEMASQDAEQAPAI